MLTTVNCDRAAAKKGGKRNVIQKSNKQLVNSNDENLLATIFLYAKKSGK
jgi:hypothetical protein